MLAEDMSQFMGDDGFEFAVVEKINKTRIEGDGVLLHAECVGIDYITGLNICCRS